MANPFKEAEERKRQEAEERKKREAAERAKQAEEAGKNEQEQPAEPVVDAPAEKVEPTVVAPVQETVPAAPAAPTFNPVEDAVNMLREKEDRTREKLEKKVPVNVMIPPSLKRKVEQDIRNKKVKSLSHLLTSLLEAYYK